MDDFITFYYSRVGDCKICAHVIPVNNAQYRTSTEIFLFHSTRSPWRVEQLLVESWWWRRLYIMSVQNRHIQNVLHESQQYLFS